MAVLPIVKWPDPRLSERCAPVESVAAVQTLITDMFDTMYAAPGRGLAGPQVGAMVRLCVMDCTWKEGDKSPFVMINPVIMATEKRFEVMDEGCLSIPGIMVPVERPVAVTVQWTSETGEIHMNDFDGFEARCIQHEFDHLNGVVTLDHTAPEDRAALEAAYRGETA